MSMHAGLCAVCVIVSRLVCSVSKECLEGLCAVCVVVSRLVGSVSSEGLEGGDMQCCVLSVCILCALSYEERVT
jgi:hypothetical protein